MQEDTPDLASAGGGSIPVLHRPDHSMIGVDAVIDKDASSAGIGRLGDAQAILKGTTGTRVSRKDSVQ